MTLSQELIWTALPNGLDVEKRPRLSAMVSPRLRTDAANAHLDPDFVDFLDWPSRVNAMDFRISLSGGPPVLAQRVSPPADSDLWTKLFRRNTSLETYQFQDFTHRKIRSFPVAGILSYVNSLYQDIAQTSPDDLPPVGPLDTAPAPGTLGGLLQDLGRTTGHFRAPHGDGAKKRVDRHELTALLGTDAWAKEKGELILDQAAAYARRRRFQAVDVAFANSRVVPPGATPSSFGFASQPAMDFYLARRFYDRPEMLQDYLDHPDAAQVPPAPDKPAIDFHRLIAVVGDYPVLLRMLGLVVDLAIDPPNLPFGTGVVRIVATSGAAQPLSAFTTTFTPGTQYRHLVGRFEAEASAASDIEDGMLMLEGASDGLDGTAGQPFSVVQIDPDGAALKLVNMASELFSVHSPAALMGHSFDTPDKAGLPTLRSVGLGLVQHERAVRVANRLADELARNNTPNLSDVVHLADHITRGYRIDVLDGETWHSLCRRRGTYTIKRTGEPDIPVTLPGGEPIVDEGYVKSASATSADDQSSDFYLHETLARWDGWSLVARRPGRTIVPKESADRLHQSESVEWQDPEPTDDLPMKTSFVPESHTLPRLRFGQSYRLRARTVDLAGNSLLPAVTDDSHATDPVLYARFEPITPPSIVPRAELVEGESVERLVIRSNFDMTTHEYSAAHPQSAPVTERPVVPPQSSQLLAEAHGKFDAALGEGASPQDVADAFALAVREAGTLTQAPGSVMVPGKLPPDAPDPDSADTRPIPGAYLINPEPQFDLPYLPDPACKGAAFRGLPGTAAAELRDFGGPWPDLLPFVLRIQEREGTVQPGQCAETFLVPAQAPEWADQDRLLKVFLGKGEVAVVRYSCNPNDALQAMAVWRRWLEPTADSGLRDLVVSGSHWMISPFRELVLVHAVQQPLCAPSIRLMSSRLTGDTFAELRGLIQLSVKSTGLVDLDASWVDPVDSLSDVKPKDLPGQGHVAGLGVDARLPEPDPWPNLPPNADGTQPEPGQGGLPLGFPDVDHVLSLGLSIKDPVVVKEFRRPVKHEFGDTKHRWVTYRATGTTRFREYFPPEVTSVPKNINRTGDPVLVNILSSARPDAPRILYIVPSFRWVGGSREGNWTTFSRTRLGGGLRVWMERPWFSSGESERLAVVMWPGDLEPPEFFGKLVSRFGRDPTWGGVTPGTTLHPNHFSNTVDTDAGLFLDEASGAASPAIRNATVEIAAFQPEYNEDRRLWFCDIDLTAKSGPSYFPFVRLALARYQRHSISNAEKLSRVIQTDFAQLLPNRSLSVTFRDADTLDIAVFGPAPTGPIRNRVEVALEHHDGQIPGDLGWARVPAAPSRPNPVHLSDGMPNVSWIPPKIPGTLRQPADLRRSSDRFRMQGRPAIARQSLPTVRAAVQAGHTGLEPVAAGPTGLLPILVIPGYELWSGPMELPPDRANLGPLRLVVREYEHFQADDDVGKLDTDKEDPHISGRYLDRVVYADIIDLP